MTPATVTAKIVAEVARQHGSSPAELCGRAFKHRLFEARHELIQRLRSERPHLSMPQIGAMLGGRHHTTIVHYLYREQRLRRRREIARAREQTTGGNAHERSSVADAGAHCASAS